MLLTLFHLCWLQSRPESNLRSLGAQVGSSRQPPLLPNENHDAMANWRKTGNVFMKIVGGTQSTPAGLSPHVFSDYQENYLSGWYFHASYALYPRRILLAPATVVINNGRDLMQNRFVPQNAWLQAHDVHSVLVVGFDERGRALPVQWNPFPSKTAAMVVQTNNPGGDR